MTLKTNKILLIKPFYNAWPVGFAYVLACLERNGVPFDFIDASRSQNIKKDIRHKLSNNRYLAVASGGLIGMFAFFKEIKNLIGKHQKETPFILGGNITKDASDDLLFKQIGINFGVQGEAETSLPGLVDAIARSNTPVLIPGAIYKEKGKVYRNTPIRYDLKENVLPAWSKFDTDFYIKNSSSPFIGNDLKFMPILTGRGCIGRCTFCSPSIGGFRKRPMEQVMAEVDELSLKYDFEKIMFYNEMFYPTISEIKDFCEHYSKLENRRPWIAQIRVDSKIDVETFTLMKKAGCVVVSAGIESGSDRVLAMMNKRVTSEQVRSFFRGAKIAGMPANGTFIVGNEGETESDLKKTIDLVIEEEINAGESLMYVYPGTAVYNNALSKGLIKDSGKYLKKMTKNTTALFIPDIRGSHLNVSDIAEDRYINVLTSQVRRYNTFVFNRYQVKGLLSNIKISGRQVTMSMEGKCPECDNTVKNNYPVFNGMEYAGVLGLGIDTRFICPNCFNQVAFNLYASEDFKYLGQYLKLLKEKLSGCKNIVIAGMNEDALLLLRVNFLDFDYDKILGFVDLRGAIKKNYYVNYKVYKTTQLPGLKPDCILMADSLWDRQEKIKMIFKSKGLLSPEILYLFDERLLKVLRKIQSDSGYNSVYSKMMVSLKNKYLGLRGFCNSRGIEPPDFIADFARNLKRRFSSDSL